VTDAELRLNRPDIARVMRGAWRGMILDGFDAEEKTFALNAKKNQKSPAKPVPKLGLTEFNRKWSKKPRRKKGGK
jgi:hypothetical protein